MANCDFYALAEDCRVVLDFIFEQDGWVLHELSSRPDHEMRAFRATNEVWSAFSIGATTAHFQLHGGALAATVRVDAELSAAEVGSTEAAMQAAVKAPSR